MPSVWPDGTEVTCSTGCSRWSSPFWCSCPRGCAPARPGTPCAVLPRRANRPLPKRVVLAANARVGTTTTRRLLPRPRPKRPTGMTTRRLVDTATSPANVTVTATTPAALPSPGRRPRCRSPRSPTLPTSTWRRLCCRQSARRRTTGQAYLDPHQTPSRTFPSTFCSTSFGSKSQLGPTRRQHPSRWRLRRLEPSLP